MTRLLLGFGIAAGIVLVINLVLVLMLGLDCDSNRLWILMNLPGLPCGIGLILFVRSESAGLAATMLGSCLVWGALGAGVVWLISKRAEPG